MYIIDVCDGMHGTSDTRHSLQGAVAAFMFYAEPLSYAEYVFPTWANGIGWLITATSLSLIPGYAIYHLITTPGTFKQVRQH